MTLLAIASMLNVTAREWPGIAVHDVSLPDINHLNKASKSLYESVRRHQSVDKQKANKRACLSSSLRNRANRSAIHD